MRFPEFEAVLAKEQQEGAILRAAGMAAIGESFRFVDKTQHGTHYLDTPAVALLSDDGPIGMRKHRVLLTSLRDQEAPLIEVGATLRPPLRAIDFLGKTPAQELIDTWFTLDVDVATRDDPLTIAYIEHNPDTMTINHLPTYNLTLMSAFSKVF